MLKDFYSHGFSLLEILITFSITLILLTLVIPSQKHSVTQSMTEVIKLQLVRAINLTRNEAIIRGEVVTLCQSSNQKTCSGRWRDGYIILSKGKVIFTFLNIRNQGELYWRAFPKYQAQLDYLPSGSLQAENGTFWYCLPAEKNPSWTIVLSQSGRAREVAPDTLEKILNNDGDPIYCDL